MDWGREALYRRRGGGGARLCSALVAADEAGSASLRSEEKPPASSVDASTHSDYSSENFKDHSWSLLRNAVYTNSSDAGKWKLQEDWTLTNHNMGFLTELCEDFFSSIQTLIFFRVEKLSQSFYKHNTLHVPLLVMIPHIWLGKSLYMMHMMQLNN